MTASLHTILLRYGYVPYAIKFGKPGTLELRTVYMSMDVAKQLDENKSNLPDDVFIGLGVKLDRFVAGERVSFTSPDTDASNGDIKALRGYDDVLFEMRFYEVAPFQRMLGVFPEKDVFVAIGIYERSELDGKWSEYCGKTLRKFGVMGNNTPECLDYHNIDAILSNWSAPL